MARVSHTRLELRRRLSRGRTVVLRVPRRVAQLTLLAVSTALALAGGELMARWLERPGGYVHEQPCDTASYRAVDDERGYAPIPGRGPFSALGLRDRPYAPTPPAGTRRIVVLGDSVAFGPGLPLAGTFDNQLEDLLTGGGTPTEALNLGVPGYNTVQERASLRALGLDLEPDLVVVAWTANDTTVTPTIAVTETGLVSTYAGDVLLPVLLRPPPRVEAVAVQRSALYRLGSRSAARAWARLRGDDQVAVISMAEVANRLAMLDVADDAQDHGAGVLFVLFPPLDHTGPDQQHERTRGFLEEHDIPVVDLHAVFANMEVGALRAFPGDLVHPSGLACGLAAERVAAEITRRGFDMGLQRERAGIHIPADEVLLEHAELPLDGSLIARHAPPACDPLDRRASRYGDPAGDSHHDDADLRDFGVAVCGDRLHIGLRVEPQLSVGFEAVIGFTLDGAGRGILIIHGDPDRPAQLQWPSDTVIETSVQVERRRSAVRVQLPIADLPGCSAQCEWHVGPAGIALAGDEQVVDEHRLRYRVAWPDDVSPPVPGTPR